MQYLVFHKVILKDFEDFGKRSKKKVCVFVTESDVLLAILNVFVTENQGNLAQKLCAKHCLVMVQNVGQ